MNEQFIYWYFCIIHPVTNSIQTPTGDCLPVNEAQWMERAGGRLLLSPGFSSSLLLPSSRPGNSLWPYHPFIQICYLFFITLYLYNALLSGWITPTLSSRWTSIQCSRPNWNGICLYSFPWVSPTPNSHKTEESALNSVLSQINTHV